MDGFKQLEHVPVGVQSNAEEDNHYQERERFKEADDDQRDFDELVLKEDA